MHEAEVLEGGCQPRLLNEGEAKTVEPGDIRDWAEGTVPAVIVPAGGLLGLDVARTLGRHGVEVIGVFTGSPSESIFAPVVQKSRFLRPYFVSHERLVEGLVELGRKLKRPSVLIAMGDREMLAISEARDTLAPWFRLRMPPHATIEMLLNKDAFAREAMRQGMAIPATIPINDTAALKSAAAHVKFPSIVKPPWRDELWQQSHGSAKVCLVQSQSELLMIGAEVLRLCGRCLVQEIVPGPETNILCTFAFVGDDASTATVVACRKIRQFPAHFGNTAMAETEQDTEAESLTREICRRLNLVGYVSVEFKRDPATGQLMILEITPGRVNRQIGITDLAGRSIVVAWYRSLAGLPPETDLPLRTGLRWASLANDFRALPAYRKEKEWPLGRWLQSYLRVRRLEFSFSDPMPLVALMGIYVSLLATWARNEAIDIFQDPSI